MRMRDFANVRILLKDQKLKDQKLIHLVDSSSRLNSGWNPTNFYINDQFDYVAEYKLHLRERGMGYQVCCFFSFFKL